MGIILKTTAQIRKLRLSGQLAAEVLEHVKQLVAPGVTTEYLDQQAARYMRSLKVRSAFLGYMGYPGNICVSINEQVVHGIPGATCIRNGDIVSLDVGIVKNGYYGDNAATVAVGSVGRTKQRLIEVTQDALVQSIAVCCPGGRIGDVSHAIETRAREDGFAVVREFVGHGIGKSMHEDPQVPNFGSPGQGVKLKVGMVIAIEPMLNAGTSEVVIARDGWTARTADRRPSAHFEHMVAITEQGGEVLTWLKKSR